MDQSEYDRLTKQYLADILRSAGPELAQAVARALENNDLDELSRLAEKSNEVLQRSRKLRAEVDKLEWDTHKLFDAAQRSRKG
jgi:hypothetical protein